MKKLIVKTDKTCNLTKYILNHFPTLNYNALQKAIRNKDIKLNSKRINKDELIKSGDILEIYITDNILYNIPKEIKYYYEDENILIAYKWQGILSNNETSVTLNEPTFENIVKKDLNNDNLRLCHRLDRNTCGLLIFAKSNEIENEITNAFKNFEIEKHYLAYANNYKFNKLHDILEDYLFKDAKTGFSKVYKEKVVSSEKIITEYSVLEQNKLENYAILDIILHTGKTHQIRAHMSYIGHELIGDSKYGKNEVNKKFKKTKQLLIAYKYNFKFNKNSKLNYLNDKIIELEKVDLKLL